jgi:hypothetical protein
MKRKIITGLFLSGLAWNACSTPLQEDSQSILLTLNDNNSARITTCEEFIALRRSGETVADYPDMPDRFANMARNSLINCYLTTYATDHGLTEITPAPETPTLEEVAEHFPATAAIAISNEEVAKVKSQYQGKTIRQKETDLKLDSNGRLISAKNADGYMIAARRIFKDKTGNLTQFIMLGKFVTEGTWGMTATYRIISQDKPVWDIQEITENSPL